MRYQGTGWLDWNIRGPDVWNDPEWWEGMGYMKVKRKDFPGVKNSWGKGPG